MCRQMCMHNHAAEQTDTPATLLNTAHWSTSIACIERTCFSEDVFGNRRITVAQGEFAGTNLRVRVLGNAERSVLGNGLRVQALQAAHVSDLVARTNVQRANRVCVAINFKVTVNVNLLLGL